MTRAALRLAGAFVVTSLALLSTAAMARADAEAPAPVPCVGDDLARAEAARSEAKTALQTLLRFVRAGSEDVEDELREWFGSADEETRQKVGDTLGRSLQWIDAVGFYCLYANDGSMIEHELQPSSGERIVVDRAGELFAYVHPSEIDKLYLGLGFFSTSETGYDSRLGTVIHEMTHYWMSGSTEDVEYGRQACRALARRDPSKALENADSYQYFVESWLAD